MLEIMLDRLPDSTRKDEGTGVYKLIKLAADGIEANETTLQTIQNWRDIDQAQGTTLDRIGRDLGQPRIGLNDVDYRQKIKIKIRANLSGGEIETLNSISLVLVGDRFQGIDEGWTLPVDHPIGSRAAMMLFTVKADDITFGIPIAEIDDISAGGVAANWQLLIDKKIQIQTNYSTSSEGSNVYTTKSGIDPDYKAYNQSYLKVGEAIINSGLINVREGTI